MIKNITRWDVSLDVRKENGRWLFKFYGPRWLIDDIEKSLECDGIGDVLRKASTSPARTSIVFISGKHKSGYKAVPRKFKATAESVRCPECGRVMAWCGSEEKLWQYVACTNGHCLLYYVKFEAPTFELKRID